MSSSRNRREELEFDDQDRTYINDEIKKFIKENRNDDLYNC